MVDRSDIPTVSFSGTASLRPIFWALLTAAVLYGLVVFLGTDLGGAAQ